MSYTAVAILSALFGAIANVVGRSLLLKVRSEDLLGLNFLIMFATLLLGSKWFYHFDFNLISAALLVLIILIDTAANFLLFKTLENNQASVATPLLSLAPFFSFVFAWVFLGETTSGATLLYCSVIVILIAGSSVDLSALKDSAFLTLVPGISSSALFALSAIPSKYLLINMHSINAPTLYMLRALGIGVFAIFLFNKGKLPNFERKYYLGLFLRGLIVIAQWILLYVALTRGAVGVTYTLANITPIFVFILGAIFLGESITARKLIAATMALILSFMIG